MLKKVKDFNDPLLLIPVNVLINCTDSNQEN